MTTRALETFYLTRLGIVDGPPLFLVVFYDLTEMDLGKPFWDVELVVVA